MSKCKSIIFLKTWSQLWIFMIINCTKFGCLLGWSDWHLILMIIVLKFIIKLILIIITLLNINMMKTSPCLWTMITFNSLTSFFLFLFFLISSPFSFRRGGKEHQHSQTNKKIIIIIKKLYLILILTRFYTPEWCPFLLLFQIVISTLHLVAFQHHYYWTSLILTFSWTLQ